MNRKKLLVLGLLALLAAAFAIGIGMQKKQVEASQDAEIRADPGRLVRMHSPVIGPQNAPVTLVEFFDPACEACRAYYPFVKELLARHPQDVRLVIRYAPFHAGADSVVKLLEASRRQNLYLPLLEAVLEAQPAWADHALPNPALTLQIAKKVGLDVDRALEDMARPEMQALLEQDIEDLRALSVRQTPTFFVNGRSAAGIGPDGLAALVAEEITRARR